MRSIGSCEFVADRPDLDRPGRTQEETQLSSALIHTARALENPFVAVAVGLLFATGLMFVSRASFRRIMPGDGAAAGMAFAALSLFGRLLFVTVSLWAYKTYFNPGFKPFAFSLAGGFLVLYTFEVVRYSGLLKQGRSVGAR